MVTRRNVLAKIFKSAASLAVALPLAQVLNPKKAHAQTVEKSKSVRWGFLIDTEKCVGCGMCVKACKLENEVPFEANVSRTWVERYVLTKDGVVHADSPKAARDGFTDAKIDQGEMPPLTIKDDDINKAFFVPKLCNQCENPPCVQVCPVGATYQTPDGIALVDRSWCIGCGYCIMACPYGARFFHPKYHVADKCTFCYHRISKGLKPACVMACPFGARQIGNLKDPNDPVTIAINTERVTVLKEEFGTKPQAYYLHMSKEVK